MAEPAPEPEPVVEPEPEPGPVTIEVERFKFTVDNDVQVRGLQLQGCVEATYDVVEACFGNPMDVVGKLKGIEWRLVGVFEGSNIVCQITAAVGTDTWNVKGMTPMCVEFVQAILDKIKDDMSTSHVSSDSAESFRIDHDVNVKSPRSKGLSEQLSI